MNFEEARKQIRKGKRVRRKSWYHKDFSLPISKEQEEEGVPYLTLEDIDADDWEVYKKVKFCSKCKQEVIT